MGGGRRVLCNEAGRRDARPQAESKREERMPAAEPLRWR